MKSELLDFYKGKRVFITGHTGFKGSWLCSILLLAGAEITGYALEPPTDPNMFGLLRLQDKIKSITGDIRDYDKLCNAMAAAKPEIVFHLAAQPIVRLSYEQPIETFSANVMGTANLLESVRHVDTVEAVVVITTDKVYENKEWLWGYRENDRLGGSDPYAASKACAEIVVHSYRSSFFGINGHHAGIATARAGNVIGGGDFATDRIIPDCIRYAGKGTPIPLRNPCSIRPWQHVLEPLCGYLMLARRLVGGEQSFCGAYNFGPDEIENLTTGELASCFCYNWGNDASWIDIGNKSSPHETNCLRLDNSKAKHDLGWKPKFSAGQAVELTVAWEKSPDKAAVTKLQINNYFNKI